MQDGTTVDQDTSDVFVKLNQVGNKIRDNVRSIAAVLAAPAVLEYVTDYQKDAVTFVVVLGIAAVCVAVPALALGAAGAEAGAGLAGVASLIHTATLAHSQF